jgi:hypothetical protein
LERRKTYVHMLTSRQSQHHWHFWIFNART